ncbi:MAG: MFS transporter [Deferribacterales bacterium]
MTDMPAKDHDRHIIPLLASFYFLHYATLGIIFPLSGYFFKERGFTGTEIGIFLAIFPFAKFAVTPLWTEYFSRISRRNLFISFCIFCSSVSLIPLAFFNSRVLVVFIMIIFAFSRAGIIPVMDSIAVSLDGRIPYGRMRLFGSMGFIATSITAGFMIDRFGLNSFIWTFMTAGLLSVIPASRLVYDRPVFRKKSADEKKMTPELTLFFVGLTLYLTSFSFLSNFLNIKTASAGLSQTQAGYMWSIGVVSEIIFFFFSEKITKIIPIKTLILASIFLGGIRYLVTGFADSFVSLFLISTFHGFAYGTFHIGIMSYIHRCVPERLKLKAQTMYSGVGYGLGTIIGSVVSGVVYDIANVRMVFVTAFFFCIVSIIILYLFVKIEDVNVCEN